jgi:hypothetical protein
MYSAAAAAAAATLEGENIGQTKATHTKFKNEFV